MLLPGWQDQGAQRLFRKCSAWMILYGGAAGGLKTTGLIADAIAYFENPRARSILFRQTYTELKNLIDRCQSLFPDLGAYQRDGGKEWVFPSGARFYLAGCQYDSDITKYKGHEFDWIGWDEVTETNEFPLRFIVSRNRSADPFLQKHLRVRLASNPGGPGHHWVKHIFIGDGCHHCDIQKGTRKPFEVYKDATWNSDGRPIDVEGRGLFTTCFIPARLTDHNLLPNYDSLLRMMSSWQEKSYREGCWKITRGQYFDCFSEQKCVVPRASIGDEWWWPHWLGADYGFSGSAAAAGLFTQTPARPGKPSGVTIQLEEYVSRMETAYDFGKTIWGRWGFVGKNQRRIIAAYLSPDSFNNRGDDPGTALSDQMEDGAAEIKGRLGFEKASNDRVAGWNLMYQMFRNGDLLISDSCPGMIAAISSRIRDPKNGNDILKKAGDAGDDEIDMCRYSVYSHNRPAAKPTELQMQELAQELTDQGIPAHERAMQLRFAQAKIDKDKSKSYHYLTPSW